MVKSEEITGICRICGNEGIGKPFNDWVRDTFTNLDMLVPGEIIVIRASSGSSKSQKNSKNAWEKISHRKCRTIPISSSMVSGCR